MASVGLVIGGSGTAGDNALRDRLIALGHTITSIDDQHAEHTGLDAYVITDSCSGSNISAKYSTSASPVMLFESGAWDNHGYAPTGGVAYTHTAIYSAVAHPITAGIADGTAFYTAATAGRARSDWSSGGVEIGTGTSGGIDFFLWAAEAGATNGTITWPARRVALGVLDAGVTALTAAGWQVFDQAIGWMLGVTTPTIAKIDTLTEDFAALDTAKWTLDGAGATVVNGQLEIAAQPTAVYHGIYSNAQYDLTASAIHLQSFDKIAGAASAQTTFTLQLDTQNHLAFIYEANGTLLFRSRAGGVDSVTSVPFDAATMRVWRFREAAGTVYWETSPDGTTWAVQRSLANPFDLTALGVSAYAGYFDAAENGLATGRSIFDNVNLPPSAVTTGPRAVQTATAITADELATSLSVTLPAAPVVGNLLTLHLTGDKSLGTVTPPAGWTVPAGATYAGLSVTGASAYRIADGTETGPITWTWTTAEGAVAAVQEHDFKSAAFLAAATYPNPANETDVNSVGPGSITGHATDAGYVVASHGIDTQVTDGEKWTATEPVFSNMTRSLRQNGNNIVGADSGGAAQALAHAPLPAGATLSSTVSWTGGIDQAYLTMMGFASNNTPAADVTSPWVGAVTPDSATVVAKTTNTSWARLAVSTSADMSAPTHTTEVAPDAQGVVRVPVAGLTADTLYYYSVEVRAESGTTSANKASGQFRTAPTAAKTFTFAFSSCRKPQVAGYTPAATTAIRNSGAELFIQAGDFHYEYQNDTTRQTVADYRAAWDSVVTEAATAALLANIPTAYAWDDHDYSTPDDGDINSASRPNVAQAFRERVPHYPLPADSDAATTDNVGIWQTFTWGRARFILLDVRSQRSPKANADDATKTMLGSAQKAWLLSTLDNSTEPVVFVFSGVPWAGPKTAGADWWGGYDTERQELVTEITSRGHAGRVVICAGDMHALAADDGTNSPGGFPVLQAGPMAQTSSHKGGPYTAGPYPATTGVYSEQYGLVTVTDTGGSSISVAFSGRDSGGVERLALTETFSTAATGATILRHNGTTWEKRKLLTRNADNTAWVWV